MPHSVAGRHRLLIMRNKSSMASLALVASLIGAACGADSIPLTAPTTDAIVGSYALVQVNGVPVAPVSPAAPVGAITADTLSLVVGGTVNRTYYPITVEQGRTYTLRNQWQGDYTVTGVSVTFLYFAFDGVLDARTETMTGTLAGEGSIVRSMSVSSHDSVFVYAKLP
jgi:hypothetical protein